MKSYGVGSPECLATSNLMQQVVTLGLKVTTGSTTQDSGEQVTRWGLALAQFTKATQKVCS